MPYSYVRELSFIIVTKVFVLIILFFMCFSPKNRPHIGPQEASNLILLEETPHARP
jgi:hypothetical protein